MGVVGVEGVDHRQRRPSRLGTLVWLARTTDRASQPDPIRGRIREPRRTDDGRARRVDVDNLDLRGVMEDVQSVGSGAPL